MSFAATLVRGIARRARGWSFAQASRRGRLLGRVVHGVDRRHRRVALGNLRHAYPDRDEAWRRRVARGAFEQAGRTAVETLWSEALDRDNLPQVADTEGLERLQAAARQGRGVIVATAHFGNWELLGIALGLLGAPLVSIARPLDDADLERTVLHLRTRTGNTVIPKTQAVRGALRALGEGRILAVLVDQNTQRHEAVFVPFFHDLAATTPVLGHLHLRTGAPVIPAFSVPAGDRYRLVVEDAVHVSAGDPADAVRDLTAAVTARIERRVREMPAAWLWMHDRWRERPL